MDWLKPGAFGAPIWVEYAGTILGIAVLFVFGRWQMLKGKAEATEPGPMVQGRILGAVIDEHKANELITAVDRLTLAVVDHTTSTRTLSRNAHALTARIEDNTAVTAKAIDEIGEARSDIRELTRELIRSKQ